MKCTSVQNFKYSIQWKSICKRDSMILWNKFIKFFIFKKEEIISTLESQFSKSINMNLFNGFVCIFPVIEDNFYNYRLEILEMINIWDKNKCN